MPSSTFEVEKVFPDGVVLNCLIQEMSKVWPEDLWRDSTYSLRGGRADEIATTGTLIIDTPRKLSKAERDMATDHFMEHETTNPVGFCMAMLPDATVMAGQQVYCNDCHKPHGLGKGAMVYSDGVSWLMVANDTPVAS